MSRWQNISYENQWSLERLNSITYVPTDQQFADIFTKNLGKQKFEDGKKALQLLHYKPL